jgi:hypothetical protein
MGEMMRTQKRNPSGWRRHSKNPAGRPAAVTAGVGRYTAAAPICFSLRALYKSS